MDIKIYRTAIVAFVLGVLAASVVLVPLWLFTGVSKEDAADIIVEELYSDIGGDYVVEVLSVEEFGKDMYKVDVSVKKIVSAENVSHLVTKGGNIIREIENIEEGTGQEAAAKEDQAPSGTTEDGVHVKGPADAKVTIIEYSDFQCPYCARFYEGTYKQILETYPDDVRIIFKDFPLSFHAQATPAAEAAECAGAQGKYWEYHDKLFEKQQEWSTGGQTAFEGYAEELGLDMDSFKTCVETREFKANIEADFREGQRSGVRGTPAFFINGKLVSGAQPFTTFKAEIDAALAEAG